MIKKKLFAAILLFINICVLYSACNSKKNKLPASYDPFPKVKGKNEYIFPSMFMSCYDRNIRFTINYNYYSGGEKDPSKYSLFCGSGSPFAMGKCQYSKSYKNPETQEVTQCIVLDPPAKEQINFKKCDGKDEDKEALLKYFFPNNHPCVIYYDPNFCELNRKAAFVYKDSAFFDSSFSTNLGIDSETKVRGIPAIFIGFNSKTYTPKEKTFAYSEPDVKSQKKYDPHLNWKDFTDKKVKVLKKERNYPFYHGIELRFSAKTKEKYKVNDKEDYWYYFTYSNKPYWIFGADLEDWDYDKKDTYASYIIEHGIKEGFIETKEVDLLKYPKEIQALDIGEEGASVIYYNENYLAYAYPYVGFYAEYDRSAMKVEEDGYVKFTYGPEENQKYLFILGDQISQFFSNFKNDGKIQYSDEDDIAVFGQSGYHDYYFEDISASSYFTETLGGRKIEYKAENLARCFEVGCRCHPYWWNYSHIPWVEGAEGNGIGESITITFKQDMVGMSVLNGYTELNKLKLFKENSRLKEVLLEDLVNGESWTVSFEDMVYFNFIKFPKATKKVKMTIQSVYEGSKYQDTCVSAIIPCKNISDDEEYKKYIYENFKSVIVNCDEVSPQELLTKSPYGEL